MESGAVQRSEETGGDGGGDDDEGAQRRRYRPRDASVAPREWSTYFPRVAYDRDDRRCELASALIDAMCAVRGAERLFDEVRRVCCVSTKGGSKVIFFPVQTDDDEFFARVLFAPRSREREGL